MPHDTTLIEFENTAVSVRSQPQKDMYCIGASHAEADSKMVGARGWMDVEPRRCRSTDIKRYKDQSHKMKF